MDDTDEEPFFPDPGNTSNRSNNRAVSVSVTLPPGGCANAFRSVSFWTRMGTRTHDCIIRQRVNKMGTCTHVTALHFTLWDF